MPKITVIVPVYNAEKTIKRAVNSITGQSFSDFELILVDDGSKDASGRLCDMLAKEDARIKVIHKQNAGVSAARNDGMKAASGEYIQFVDSDDYLPDNFLERMICTQEEYGRDTFVWCGVNVIYENLKTTDKLLFFREPDKRIITSTEDIFALFQVNLLNPLDNKLFVRDIIVKNHLRMDESIQIAEDLLFNIQYLESLDHRMQIVVENTLAYSYVQSNDNSLSNRYYPDSYDIHRRILRELWDYGKKIRITKRNRNIFYEKYWEYVMNALENYQREECSLTLRQKRKIRGRMLRDSFFQKGLKLKKNKMSRGPYLCMRLRSAILLTLYEKVRN